MPFDRARNAVLPGAAAQTPPQSPIATDVDAEQAVPEKLAVDPDGAGPEHNGTLMVFSGAPLFSCGEATVQNGVCACNVMVFIRCSSASRAARVAK